MKIQNTVVIADFGEALTLEDLSQKHNMVYEPDQFPGAIFRIKEPYKATILVFASGKTVITGLKSIRHIKAIVARLTKVFKESAVEQQ